MKLIDSNVWLALTLNGHPRFEAAQSWFRKEPPHNHLLFCRATQITLLRLLTTSSIFKPFGDPPLAIREAWTVVDGYRSDARVGFADEPANLEAAWKRLTESDLASPKLWMDAYLAAFAMAGGYRLATFDRVFGQFEGLDLELLESRNND